MKLTNLQKLRLSKGWTQKEVSEKLEISFSYYSKIEGGFTLPTIKLARKIAALFNVETIDEILRAS